MNFFIPQKSRVFFEKKIQKNNVILLFFYSTETLSGFFTAQHESLIVVVAILFITFLSLLYYFNFFRVVAGKVYMFVVSFFPLRLQWDVLSYVWWALGGRGGTIMQMPRFSRRLRKNE